MKKEIIRQLNFIGSEKEVKQFLKILSTKAIKLIGKQTTGRPRISIYKAIAGMIYYTKTGCTWRCLPIVFGNYKTIYNRYLKLSNLKFFESTWKKMLYKLINEGIIKIKKVIEDGSLASCASKNGLAINHPRNRNKLTINRFIATNELGIPLNFRIMPGQTHDTVAFKSTTYEVVKEFQVKTGFSVHADKGFDSSSNRKFVTQLGGVPEIARRRIGRWKDCINLNKKDEFRFVVERTFGWINSYKSLKNIFIKNPLQIKEMHCLFFNILTLRNFSKNKSLYLLNGRAF